MTSPPRSTRRRPHAFLVGLAVAALLVAGLLSYLASPAPDGLETVTLRGCTTSEVGGAERLSGQCIARHAGEHELANSPLADYTLVGEQSLTGVSGVIGVLVTLALAGGLFWLVRPRQGGRRDPGSAG